MSFWNDDVRELTFDEIDFVSGAGPKGVSGETVGAAIGGAVGTVVGAPGGIVTAAAAGAVGAIAGAWLAVNGKWLFERVAEAQMEGQPMPILG